MATQDGFRLLPFIAKANITVRIPPGEMATGYLQSPLANMSLRSQEDSGVIVRPILDG